MVRYEMQRDKAVIFVDSPTHGVKEAYVNVEHLAKILRFSESWNLLVTAGNAVYAQSAYRHENGNRKVMLMHHLIISPEEGKEIDHVNRNGLDNRKKNLRCVTHAQNLQNQVKHKNNNSGYRNVYWSEGKRKWIAEIKINGRQIRKEFDYKINAALFAEKMRKEVFSCSEPVKYSV